MGSGWQSLKRQLLMGKLNQSALTSNSALGMQGTNILSLEQNKDLNKTKDDQKIDEHKIKKANEALFKLKRSMQKSKVGPKSSLNVEAFPKEEIGFPPILKHQDLQRLSPGTSKGNINPTSGNESHDGKYATINDFDFEQRLQEMISLEQNIDHQSLN